MTEPMRVEKYVSDNYIFELYEDNWIHIARIGTREPVTMIMTDGEELCDTANDWISKRCEVCGEPKAPGDSRFCTPDRVEYIYE